jgi:hypothetical protein
MEKYTIRRVLSSKNVVAQAGFDEMTNIVDTKDQSSINAFADQATDPTLIVQGTAGLDYVKDQQGNVQRKSVNPEYGMFHGAPGEGMPMEFSLTADEMDYLNKHPEEKVEYETNKLRDFLDKTRPAQLNQIFPKLESLYQIYRSAPYGLALDKLKEEARNVKQLNATDLNMIKSRPYWPLIKDIVE